LDLAGKAHDGKHDTLNTGAGLPLNIVYGFRFHFLLDQVFEFQRNGGEPGKEHNQYAGKERHTVSGSFVHKPVIAGDRKQRMQDDGCDTASLIELFAVCLSAEPFNDLRNEQTCNQESGEFYNINKDIILPVKHKIGNEIER